MTPEEKTIARKFARANWAILSLQLLRLFPLGDGSHAMAERRLFVAAALLEGFIVKFAVGFIGFLAIASLYALM